MDFRNVYDDPERAAAYDRLEFPNTYYLAFRDLPALLRRHVRGTRALDFGCGTGRSTRFLEGLGFRAVGVDIAAEMVAKAGERDPRGDYRVIADGDFTELPQGAFDVIFSAFTFDNIPTLERKVRLFRSLGDLLAPAGKIVNLVSAPEIYTHEWASFTTKDFPENRRARSGERVLIVMKDVVDARPVEDIVWSHEAYVETYRLAALEVLLTHRPLAKGDEPFPWVSETRVAPWVVYLLEKAQGQRLPGTGTTRGCASGAEDV
jgi:SAM-dependent methyltransferase